MRSAEAREPRRPRWLRRHWAPVLFTAAPWLGLAAMTAAFIARRPVEPQEGLSVQTRMAPEAYEETEPGHGRLARWPHQIPLRGWKDISWRVVREAQRDRITAVAGGVTFFTLLSIFPAMGVFVSLYGLISDVGAVQRQLAELSTFIPGDILSLLGDQMLRLATLRQANLSVAFLVSLLLSIWTASAGVKALIQGLNVAYEQTERRNFFVFTAIAYASTFGGLIFLTVVTAMLVAVPLALRYFGLAEYGAWWIQLRWIVLGAIAAGFFSILYRYGPCRKRPKWRWVTFGGIFAALLWLFGSLGFSWYLNNLATYDVTYGSLGTAIAFMTWIWFSVLVVLLGAELSAETEHQTALDTTIGPDQPMGERGAVMADTVGLARQGSFRKAVRWAWRGGRGGASRAFGFLRGRPRAAPADQANSSSKAASRPA